MILAGALLLAGAAAAAAPAPLPRPPGYSIRVWSTSDGLPSDSVVAMVQTRDGFLWIGTRAGLARFDGARFEIFDRASLPALGSDECWPLIEDASGGLWLATMGGGLTCLRNGKATSPPRDDGVGFGYVMRAFSDPSGKIWLGTDGPLHVIENGRLRRVDAQTLPLDHAQPIWVDDDGRLWLRGRGGMGTLFHGTYTPREALEPAPPPGIAGNYSMIRGEHGTVWVAQTQPVRVWRIQRTVEGPFDLTDARSDERFARMIEASDGSLWVGLTGGGVRHLASGRFEAIGLEEGLPAAPVTALLDDREGNLWVASTAGLARVTRRTFASVTAADGLHDARVWAVLADSRGDVWIGTEAYLERIHDGRMTTYRPNEGLPSVGVVSLAEGGDGAIWAGTTGGLARFDGTRFERVALRDVLADENVRALFADGSGRMWIGTHDGGLAVFDNGRLRVFTPKDGLGSPWVRFVGQDATGDIWACTTGGLSRIRDGRVTTFHTTDGLAGEMPLGVLADAGALWIGTYGHGSSRLEAGRFVSLGTREGLPDDSILRMLDDGRGGIWLSTPHGIFRVAKSDLDDVADGRKRRMTPIAYGSPDGLPSTDCGGGSQPAGSKGPDGRLWFPTSKGVAVVDPASLGPPAPAPPVRIDAVVHDQTTSAGSTPVDLEPGTRSVEFRYAAIALRAPEKIRFRYRLEGFDPDWIDAGGRRVAYYTHLPPGGYRFRVVAASADGIWNDEGASVDARQRPFFWQTAWFWSLGAAALVAGAFGLYRLRLRQAERRFAAVLAERTRIARELHDTVAQGFTGVSMLLEAAAARLDGADPEARESLDRARLTVRTSLADARRSIRDLRPALLERGDLPSALRATAAQVTASTGVEVTFAPGGRIRRLPAPVEDALLRVAQEALTNAVRHGQCTRACVSLTLARDTVELAVEDDGAGFDGPAPPSANGGGLGLVGMRERMIALGGSLEVASARGRGTRVVAKAPARDAGTGERA